MCLAQLALPAPMPLHYRLAPPFLKQRSFEEALPGPDAALCHLVTSLDLFGGYCFSILGYQALIPHSSIPSPPSFFNLNIMLLNLARWGKCKGAPLWVSPSTANTVSASLLKRWPAETG